MGISASSLLDETKSNYIKGQVEAELKAFSPYYRKQFPIAYFSQVEDELEQHKDKITQLLKQRLGAEEGEVLYEEGVQYFDDTRKWRDRYVVVRANYCLECHDSLESFMKGVPPRHKLLPTGGTVLTTEEKYMAMVDKCFPDETNNVKEEFAPPLSGMPGQFPVYLRLPYRRDSYFCFRQEAKQASFISIMLDCIRHQNQDFLKKKTCEVQAFLKAIQFYRQDKGKYEAWEMLRGSDVRVMANLVMEPLLPYLEKDMLPRLKAKKTEKKRVWFATVEAAYILVQECLLEGLAALKEECRTSVRQQEVLIHSDMDQILSSRVTLENKLRASVSEPAEKFCSESIQPYLASVLDELMEPISSGFGEARHLSDSMMDQLCKDFEEVGGVTDNLKKSLVKMARPDLLSCYQKISSLQEKLHHLQERFGYSNITSLIHCAQIDLQQLMTNAAYTFEQLMTKAIQDNPDNAGSAIEKAKHRVLKQYDYDSSTVRKRIVQEALVSITLPHIKKNLAPTCRTALEGLEQFIYADHSNFVHVENIYEGILLQTLDKEITKVVSEAASLKKHNLFTDSRDLLNQSSRSSLSSPSASTPGSPVRGLASTSPSSQRPSPPSPLVTNGLSPVVSQDSIAVEEQQVPGQAETGAALAVVPVVAEARKSEEAEVSQSDGVGSPEQQPASVENATEVSMVHVASVQEDIPDSAEAVPLAETVAVEPEKEDAVVEPAKVEAAIEPEKKDAGVEPAKVEAAIEPEKKDAGVEPAKVEAAIEPEKKDASVGPAKVEAAIEPEKKYAGVGPAKVEAAIELEKEDAGVEPAKVETAVEEPEKEDKGVEKAKEEAAIEPEKEDAGVEQMKPEAGVEPEKAEAGIEPEKVVASVEPEKTDKAEKVEAGVEPEKAATAFEPEKTEATVEPETHCTSAPTPIVTALSQNPGNVESVAAKADAEKPEAPQSGASVSSLDAVPVPSSAPEPAGEPVPAAKLAESSAPEPAGEPVPAAKLAEGMDSLTVTVTEGDSQDQVIDAEAPSSGGEPVSVSSNGSLEPEANTDLGTTSSSLNVSMGVESPQSVVESMEGDKAQSSEDEGSTTSDLLEEEEVNSSESPVSSDEHPADASEEASVAPSSDPSAPELTEVTADANHNIASPPSTSLESSVTASAAPASAAPIGPGEDSADSESTPLDSILAIRGLVEEVIEVEELLQRYPSGVPMDN